MSDESIKIEVHTTSHSFVGDDAAVVAAEMDKYAAYLAQSHGCPIIESEIKVWYYTQIDEP